MKGYFFKIVVFYSRLIGLYEYTLTEFEGDYFFETSHIYKAYLLLCEKLFINVPTLEHFIIISATEDGKDVLEELKKHFTYSENENLSHNLPLNQRKR